MHCPCGGEIQITNGQQLRRRGKGVILLDVPRARCKRCKRKFKNSGREQILSQRLEPRCRF